MWTLVSSCALARLSTAMAKKTFSSVSVLIEVMTNAQKHWSQLSTYFLISSHIKKEKTGY